MNKMSKPKQTMVHIKQDNDYHDYWDFKVYFPNSSIVYYFTLDEEMTTTDLNKFLIERFRSYIASHIYFTDYNPNEYDKRQIDKINDNMDLRRALAIVTKYLVINHKSKLVTQT